MYKIIGAEAKIPEYFENGNIFVIVNHRIIETKFLTYKVKNSVADPDPKDPHHFAGSGSLIFSTDPDPKPDPDLNEKSAHIPPLLYFLTHT